MTPSRRHDVRKRGFLEWLADRSITPYMRTRDSIHRHNSTFYGPERFTYQPESNSYRCPVGQPRNYGGRNLRNRVYAYIGTRKRCCACALKALCTSGAFSFLATHMDEPARQRSRELVNTPEFAKALWQRKKESGSVSEGCIPPLWDGGAAERIAQILEATE